MFALATSSIVTAVFAINTIFLPIVTTAVPMSPATSAVMYEDGSYEITNDTGYHTGCVQNTACDELTTDEIILDTAEYTEYTNPDGAFVYGFNVTGYYAIDFAPVNGYHLCSGNVCETYLQQDSVE